CARWASTDFDYW
nr:immunoglobulin heavy chain junction region [Macaca mulatta]